MKDYVDNYLNNRLKELKIQVELENAYFKIAQLEAEIKELRKKITHQELITGLK